MIITPTISGARSQNAPFCVLRNLSIQILCLHMQGNYCSLKISIRHISINSSKLNERFPQVQTFMIAQTACYNLIQSCPNRTAHFRPRRNDYNTDSRSQGKSQSNKTVSNWSRGIQSRAVLVPCST